MFEGACCMEVSVVWRCLLSGVFCSIHKSLSHTKSKFVLDF